MSDPMRGKIIFKNTLYLHHKWGDIITGSVSQMLTEKWGFLVIAYLFFSFHFVLSRHNIYTVKCTHLKCAIC